MGTRVTSRWGIAVLAAAIAVACGNERPDGASSNLANTPNPTSTPTETATATPAGPVADKSPPPADAGPASDAVVVLHRYFEAIGARDYRQAYELWSGKGEASKQTFEQFRDGFAETASVSVDTSDGEPRVEGAAGSQYVTIPVLIRARTTGGEEKRFRGEYVLRRSMVDGATDEQRSWRLYSADLAAETP
jgi:hypothetical protein